MHIIYTHTHTQTRAQSCSRCFACVCWQSVCVPSAINELLRNEMRNEWSKWNSNNNEESAQATVVFVTSVFTHCRRRCCSCCCWFIITPACNGKLQAMITTHAHTHTHRLIQSYSKIDSNLISQLVRERKRERERETRTSRKRKFTCTLIEWSAKNKHTHKQKRHGKAIKKGGKYQIK